VRRGWRVEALALDPSPELDAWSVSSESREGVELRRVAYRYQDHWALADLVRRPRAEDCVLSWAEERELDLLHVHHATGFGTSVMENLTRSGKRVMASLHDYWTLCPRGQMMRADGGLCSSPEAPACAACLAATWPHLMPSECGEKRGPSGEALELDEQAAQARTRFALAGLAACERLFVPSRSAAAAFERAGVPAQRLTLMPNPVDGVRLAHAVTLERERRPRPAGNIVLGALGLVQPSKGILELARALLLLADARVSLEVHGPRPAYHGDRGYVDELEQLAARSPRVRLHPAFDHADLPRVLARLDAVVVPSRWEEVFGLGAREALAVGLPVLVARRGGLAELDGQPGVRCVGGADLREETDWPRALGDFLSDLEILAREARGQRPAADLGAFVDRLEGFYGTRPETGAGDENRRGRAAAAKVP
jgi:glycosyltransferase involved in cell wall biosynthesis